MNTRVKCVVVNTTVAKKADARALARKIVDARLAACGQYLRIRSIYRWKGAVESAGEFLVLAKTRAALAGRLVAFIRRHHPYEVPEILVTPVLSGLPEYLNWIADETRPPKARRRA